MTAPNLLFAGSGPPYPDPEGNDVKEGIPWSTVTGIVAVLQAEAGMTGPLDLLEKLTLEVLDNLRQLHRWSGS